MVVREERKRGVTDRSDDRDRDRDPYSRRREYRREREPSPKKFRRDRDRDRDRDRERDERRTQDFARSDLAARDVKHRNSSREIDRTRDTKGTEAKRSSEGLKDGSEKRNNGGASDADGLRPDPKEFARSKIYLQHDERGSSGQVVQIHIRHDTDNTRSNPKEHKSGEELNKKTEVEVKHATKRNDDSGRRDPAPAPPSEKKIPPELDLGSKNPSKEHNSSQSAKGDEKILHTRDDTSARRDDIDRVASRDNISRSRQDDVRFGRRDEGFNSFNRGNGNRGGNWQPRSNNNRDRFRGQDDRFSGPRFRNGNQDRFSGVRFRDGNQLRQASGVQTDVQMDRWKHDKYEEANQSPTNEDDQIAKVEQLLAS